VVGSFLHRDMLDVPLHEIGFICVWLVIPINIYKVIGLIDENMMI
jgi:hypothetical protein